jgi:hypothetical protein
MPVILRGAKKFRVDAAFGGSMKAADIGTVLVEFLADSEVKSLLYFPEVVVLGR